MRIVGGWGLFEAAYVRGLVICDALGIKGDVRFLVEVVLAASWTEGAAPGFGATGLGSGHRLGRPSLKRP